MTENPTQGAVSKAARDDVRLLESDLERGARYHRSAADTHRKRRNRIRMFLPAAAGIQAGLFFLIPLTPAGSLPLTLPPLLPQAAALLLAVALLSAVMLDACTDYARSESEHRSAASLHERGLAKARRLVRDMDSGREDADGIARRQGEIAVDLEWAAAQARDRTPPGGPGG